MSERTYETIVSSLNAKIPRDEVSQREAGGGKSLSYVQGWQVIDNLNQIFGQGNWAYDHSTQIVCNEKIESTGYNGKASTKFYVAYTAKVRLIVLFPGKPSTYFEDVGYGEGFDGKFPGKAHESAIKEAVTDGLKRCAKNLGNRLGLALYDKTQENVEDAAEEPKVERPAAQGANPHLPAGYAERFVAPAETVAPVAAAVPSGSEATRDNLLKLISAKVKVVTAKRTKTLAELKAYLKDTYKAEAKEDLNDSQAVELLKYLDSLLTNKQGEANV